MKFLCLLVPVLIAVPVCAQSVNIDYGDQAGAPRADYAAAGLPGTWNVLSETPGVPQRRMDLTGRSIAATVTHDRGATVSFEVLATLGRYEAANIRS